MAKDRRIRVFRLLTGKLVTVIDESLQHYTELQQVLYRTVLYRTGSFMINADKHRINMEVDLQSLCGLHF